MDKNTVKGSRVICIQRETDTYMTKVTLEKQDAVNKKCCDNSYEYGKKWSLPHN